jgi:anhydro-N-acetylmuramic acid kinase
MPDPTERIIAGAMSGTSADGVDVALTRIAGRGTAMTAQLLRHHHRPYDADTRSEIFAFRGGDARCDLSRLAKLGRTISLTYAAAVNEALAAAHLSARDLAAVAAHGQTLYHAPPDSIQWFDPSLVAAEVGCPVVSDFRRADLAAGGQGAPLVPFADYILFRHPTKNRVLLNIGGIANLTWLPGGASLDQLVAFDTGPGNCVSDYLIRTRLSDGSTYDVGGALAMQGKVIGSLYYHFEDADYFAQRPPKSTDTPTMIALYEAARSRAVETNHFTLHDELRTACCVTVDTIYKGWRDKVPVQPHEVIVSGGGTENAVIMELLRDRCKGIPLLRTDDLGVPSQSKEALAFALLAAATLDGEPSNVPSVTGAKRPVVLGSITPRP